MSAIPDDAWPAGDRLSWDDDATLTHHDFTTDPHTQTPYTADEAAQAQARVAEAQRTAALEGLRQQLTAGVAGIVAARAAAVEDQARAELLRTQAVAAKAATLTQRQAVAGFVPTATYSATQLGQVRNALADVLARVEEIQQALADFYAYRAQVDANAVTTDDALLWLARIASGALNDDGKAP